MSPKAKIQNTSGTKDSMPGAQPDLAEVPINAAGPETTQQTGGEKGLSKAGSDTPAADAVSDTIQGDGIQADTVAPIDAAGPETTQQTGGEKGLSKAGSDTPAADAVSDTIQGDGIQADTVAPIDAAVQSAEESSIEMLQAQKTPIERTERIRVVCHVEEGRRRVDRRWPKGESLIPIGELDDYQLEQLRGDPLFTVVMPT